MIDRYAPEELRSIWSEESRLRLWTTVEQAVCRARAELGEISKEESSAISSAQPPSLARVKQLEAEQGHDLAAFVSALQEQLGDEGRQVHLGLTSQDVVDTTLAIQLRQAHLFLDRELGALAQALSDLAGRHLRTPMIGRTHGMHAEPVTFGFVLANHLDEIRRSRHRLGLAAAEVVVGKISGTVGTHATVSAQVEELALAELGLEPAAITTQVVARDRHAAYLCQLALSGAVLERLATNLRHLQRTEVGEVKEPFGARQKGSSAMPHKRNPVRLEQVCGLSRVLRGLMVAGMEDVALWHERDISHSSVERIVLPDASLLAYYSLRRAERLVDGLVVRDERMRENLLVGSYGLVFSQPVLLALVAAGCTRDAAYRMVQSAARTAFEQRRPFRSVLESDAGLVEALGPGRVGPVLEEAFDLDRALRHAHRTIDALEEVRT